MTSIFDGNKYTLVLNYLPPTSQDIQISPGVYELGELKEKYHQL